MEWETETNLSIPRRWWIDSLPGLKLVSFNEKTVMTEEDSEEHGSLIDSLMKGILKEEVKEIDGGLQKTTTLT